jgi:hypothetical protein
VAAGSAGGRLVRLRSAFPGPAQVTGAEGKNGGAARYQPRPPYQGRRTAGRIGRGNWFERSKSHRFALETGAQIVGAT